MKTVYTNLELANALENGEKHLLLKGAVAKTFLAKRKKKRWCKITGGILAVGGLIAAIPTGGASLAATAVGLTVGTVTITATEILAIFGGATLFSVGTISALKGRKIKYKVGPDGVYMDIE